MKKIILFLMVLFTTVCYAQSDFDIAQEFMNKKGIKLVPNERSLTRGTDAPYSIFNGSEGKGFCIVVNGNVVGYDTNNIVNEDDMPCCLEELLDEYSRTNLSAKTRGLSEGETKAIEPIIKTQWNQCSPYNDSIAQKTNICFFVAEAQILHYYKVNYYYEQHFFYSNLPVDLYPTTFDHDLIDREGEEGWAEETARFFKYVLHGDNVSYFSHNFEDIFGIKKDEINFSANDSRYDIYDELLENGTPIIISSPNHFFIVDGRSEDGRYHVNFGWGGYCDGYYMFPDTEADKQSINAAFEYNRDAYYWVEYYTPLKESAAIIPTMYAQANNAVYNLQGIKVGNSLNGLPKGIYIQDGKKYVVK